MNDDDRQAELGGEPHLEQGLAIALGVGAAEVAGGPLGQVLALLVADEHHFHVVEVGQPGDDRLVVADGAVAVELEELLEDQVEVVAGLGPLLMARDLDGLPGIELRIDLAFERRQLAAEAADLLADLGGVARGAVLGVLGLHLAEARFHLVDGRLERQSLFAGTGHEGEILGQSRPGGKPSGGTGRAPG